MAVYLTRWFDRWANKQGVDVQSLCVAVREMQAGLYEADLQPIRKVVVMVK
jgi:hypothetical protein